MPGGADSKTGRGADRRRRLAASAAGRSSLRIVLTALAVAACGKAGIASAQPPAAGIGTLRLSDAERAELLARNTEASVDAARTDLGGNLPRDRKVHGELGGTIGSNGLRSEYGAAAVPLGDRGSAAVSFENSRFGYRR